MAAFKRRVVAAPVTTPVFCILIVAVVLIATTTRCADAFPTAAQSSPPRERAAALLAKMTVAEKIAMTFATHTDAKTAESFAATGVGAVKYMNIACTCVFMIIISRACVRTYVSAHEHYHACLLGCSSRV